MTAFSIGIHSQTANEYLPHLATSKEESITCYHFPYFHLLSPPNTDTTLIFFYFNVSSILSKMKEIF